VGRLAAIARRDKSRAPMQTLDVAEVSATTGVAHDSRGKSQTRKVTLLSAGVWSQVCKELDKDLPWTTRRSNFLVEDIELPQRAGDIINVGEVQLQVTREVNPCSRMDEQCPGLKDRLAPDWRGGVACIVLQGGSVAVGDAVSISTAEKRVRPA